MLHKSVVMGWLVLVLFYIAHNLGTLFYQVRGVPAGEVQWGVFAYFIGIAAGGVFIRQVESLVRSGREQTGRIILLAVLAAPALLCQVSLNLLGYQGTPLLNALQPMLWAMHLPVALHYFNRNVPAQMQALVYGLVLGIGYFGWALLMPLLSPSYDIPAFPTLELALPEYRFLPLLNSTRNVFGVAFALVCWYLAATGAATEGVAELRPAFPSDLTRHGRRCQMLMLLSPFAACFFLNGFTGYLFFSRVFMRAPYPEYMYLMLAVVCPLVGLIVYTRGDRSLYRLVCGSVAIYGTLPLLLYLDVSQAVEYGVYTICSICQQLLVFTGILIFLRFARFSAFPGLTASLPWLACGVAIASHILATGLPRGLPVSPVIPAVILGVLCLAALFPFTRAFHLPPAQARLVKEDGNTAEGTGQGAHTASRAIDPAVLTAFAAAYRLTGRETQILHGLAHGKEPAAIGLDLGISESTVRYHQTGLFRKTGQPDRRRFLLFFAGWQGADHR